jgi:hypothetical protein
VKRLFEVRRDEAAQAFRSLDHFGNNVKDFVGVLNSGEFAILVERTDASHWSTQDGYDLFLTRFGLCYVCRFALQGAT